ncbi:MAG TPA: nucleotide exchange factor GrpE, partial [Afipia sp.]|nr:nucleotide exchange factor GrpE [Afipia sp.]
MANSNGQKEPQDASAPEPANDKEPVVSKPYVMPDDPEEGSVEALTKEVAEA